MLALFDKPDPLDGPTFEETLYVTPSRRPEPDQRRMADTVAAAARALGLETGPVHAELRWSEADGGPVLVEIAARPIGGLCARSLRFESGFSLEDVVVRHALGTGAAPARIAGASGVMMIPTPARVPSALRAVDGVAAARAVAGVDDVVISVRVGETLVPLPEGASYTGFIFATGDDPSLRRAGAARGARATAFHGRAARPDRALTHGFVICHPSKKIDHTLSRASH